MFYPQLGILKEPFHLRSKYKYNILELFLLMAMGRNYTAGDSKVLKLFLIYKAYDSSYNLEHKR